MNDFYPNIMSWNTNIYVKAQIFWNWILNSKTRLINWSSIIKEWLFKAWINDLCEFLLNLSPMKITVGAWELSCM